MKNKLNDRLEQFILKNDYEITSVGLCRQKNGEDISEDCIKFRVKKKKSEAELPTDKILPKKIEIDGKEYLTDVEEYTEELPRLLACYSPNDPEILRLRGNPSLLTPLKGGQEIIMYPTGWTSEGEDYNFFVGTLGFFAIDNVDNRIVGVTNAHVVCDKKVLASDRQNESTSQTYNTVEPITWIFDNQQYRPGALSLDGNTINTTVLNIKRYSPFRLSGPNYTDLALLIMNPVHLNNNSYMVHNPTTVVQNEDYMPFATTAELDNLLITNPRVYSVGRTTGPKGWGEVSSCRLRITQLALNVPVQDPEGTFNPTFGVPVIPFNDIIEFRYEDNSDHPIDSGDSGSMVFAEIDGVRKIIGVAFAGSTTTGLLCRIDRIVEEFNIRAWDSSHVLNESTPLQPTIVKHPITDATSDLKQITVGGETYYQAGTSNSGT